MDIPLFLLNMDLAVFIITLVGQSILISFSGFIVMKLLKKRSAPARSLVCIAAITSLGVVLAASAGFYFSGISLYKKDVPLIAKESIETYQLSQEPDRAFTPEPVSFFSEAPLLTETEKDMSHTISDAAPESSGLTVPPYVFINVFGLIWLAGIMFQLLKICHGLLRVNNFRKSISFRSDTPFPEIIRDIADRFQKDCINGIYTSSLINSPMVMGLINPVVVIPEKVFSTLSKNEMKSILLHEISHIYHHDQIADIIKRAVLALHWWNPLVSLINRYHEQAREEVADNHVLQDLAPAEYSRCIMDLVEKVCLTNNLPAASAMAGRHFNLRKRVEQILSKKRSIAMRTKLRLKAAAFGIGLVLTFVVAGLHARGSAMKNDDTVRVSQEPLQAINSVSITKEDQNLTQKNIPDPEAVDEPDKLQAIPIPVTMPQKELSVKQEQENEKPVIVMVSVDMKAMNKNEKLLDSAGIKQDVEPVIKKDEAKTILLAQNKTEEKQDSKAIDVSDNGAFNNRPEDAANDSKKEDIDTAIAEVSRQIKLNDSDARLYLLRGNLHMDNQDYGQALNDYTKAIEINPDDATAYNNRGQTYVNMGEYKQAIKEYKQAIKRDPENKYAYFNRGNVYLVQKKYRRAISDYSKAIKINPEFIQAYINRGIAYNKNSNPNFLRSYITDYKNNSSNNNAVKDFSKALELNAGNAEVYVLRGNAYLIKGECRQAINDYSKALEIGPESYYVYLQRGNAYSWKEDFYSAISDYSRAIELKPDLFAAYMERSEAYRLTKQFTKAANDLKTAVKLDPVYISQITKEEAAITMERAKSIGKHDRRFQDFNKMVKDYNWPANAQLVP